MKIKQTKKKKAKPTQGCGPSFSNEFQQKQTWTSPGVWY